MKIRRNVTDAVRRAARENGSRSKGPASATGKLWSARNALKHGALARTAIFRNVEEQEAFDSLFADLKRDFKPRTVVESMMLEEIALAWIRRGRALVMERKASRKRNGASDTVGQVIQATSDTLGWDGPYQLESSGFDVSEFAVSGKKDTGQSRANALFPGEDKDEQHFDIRVTFKDPMELALRYGKTARSDLLKFLHQIRKLQGKS